MIGCRGNTVDVEVRPFKHQVGGHTCVLEVTKSVICKPYVPREAWFYRNEPEELKQFTPKYIGETTVTCDINGDKKSLVAKVPECVVSRNEEQVTSIASIKLSSEIPEKKCKILRSIHSRETEQSVDDQGRLETWSTICIDRQIERYGFWANNQPQKFILLENLVHEYDRPCLMDLKMGRRQFGDDSDEEKRKLLQSRCASSTSSTLGFRICGSQTFNVTDKTYVVHDKYVGRNLDANGAKDELRSFFFNGLALRKDVIKELMNKIETLRRTLRTQDLLFYSVSLLLLYDGALPECSDTCVCNNGIRESLQPLPGAHNGDNLERDNGNLAGTADKKQEVLVCDKNKLENIDVSFSKADLRMIDFAHVSLKEESGEDEKVSEDETIIFGLHHLHKVLNDILQENGII